MQSVAHSGADLADLVVFEVRVRMPGLQGLGRKKSPAYIRGNTVSKLVQQDTRIGSIDINIIM